MNLFSQGTEYRVTVSQGKTESFIFSAHKILRFPSVPEILNTVLCNRTFNHTDTHARTPKKRFLLVQLLAVTVNKRCYLFRSLISLCLFYCSYKSSIVTACSRGVVHTMS